MQDIAAYLDTFQPTIRRSQYALGGNWERAIKLDLDKPAPLAKDQTVDASVAIELFYDLNDKRMAFIGLRYAEGLAQARTPAAFLQAAIEVICRAKTLTIAHLFKQLGEAVNAANTTYLAQDIKYAELGVVDFWKSAGSLIVRHSEDDKVDATSVKVILQQNPKLMENTLNYTAIELAVKAPEAWVGIQVSHLKDGAYSTDLDTLTTLANMA